MASESRPRGLAATLLRWYARRSRSLPWRRGRHPYRVWLSEIMLQQTRVEAVIPYYDRFLRAFPDVRSLAAAPLDRVLALWAGLGYYARARNLHEAARRIVAAGGRFPTGREGWRALPGVGAYTAAALASIVDGESAIALDGNLVRVGARLIGERAPIESPAARARIEDALRSALPPRRAGDFNQALMDLGATICLPRGPRCSECPVRRYCRAFASGSPDALPARRARPMRTTRDFVVAVVRDDAGRVLVARQPERGLWGGLWAMPFVAGRDWKTAIAELENVAGTELTRASHRAVVEHAFTHFVGRYHAYGAKARRKIRRRGLRWVDPTAPGIGVPAAHAAILRAIVGGAVVGRGAQTASRTAKNR